MESFAIPQIKTGYFSNYILPTPRQSTFHINFSPFSFQIKIAIKSTGDCVRRYEPKLEPSTNNKILLHFQTNNTNEDMLLFHLGKDGEQVQLAFVHSSIVKVRVYPQLVFRHPMPLQVLSFGFRTPLFGKQTTVRDQIGRMNKPTK